MSVTGPRRQVRVEARSGLLTMLKEDSPFGGGEVDALFTLSRPDGLFFLVCVAPEKDYDARGAQLPADDGLRQVSVRAGTFVTAACPARFHASMKKGDRVMIDAKQAISIAKAGAADLLSQDSSNLEEIERDSYRGRDVWSITLSLPRKTGQMAPFAALALTADPLQYKRFLVDSETGELVAVRLREVAPR